MNPVRVVGLAGAHPRVGKDTVGSWLVDLYGYRRISLAEPLKDRYSKQFCIPRRWLDDPAQKEAHRGGLCAYGRICEEQGNGYGLDDIWVRLSGLKKAEGPVVVTDVRYRRQAQAVWDLGGVMVWVWDDLPWAGQDAGDLTERDCDFPLYNPRGPESLNLNLKKYLRPLLGLDWPEKEEETQWVSRLAMTPTSFAPSTSISTTRGASTRTLRAMRGDRPSGALPGLTTIAGAQSMALRP